MKNQPNIVVVGSFIMDLVFRTYRRPNRGETVIGNEFGMFTGGKGYNQAIAASRLGANVIMVGCVGTDLFGDMFISSLQKDGVDINYVIRNPNAGTGVACPVVYESEGDNSIIIVPRANLTLTPEHIEAASSIITAADMLMLQLEIPVETSMRAAEIAHAAGIPVMLNPAPFSKLPDNFYQLIDIITPNEIEASQLTGMQIDDMETAKQVGKSIMSLGPKIVVLTLGQRGAYYLDLKEEFQVPAFKVNTIDPTAAGDAFCAGFAVAISHGQNPLQAVQMGNAAGGLATTVLGAEPSLPKLEQVLALLKQ
ncbi:MAG: ribokinase [Anaerolineaceae bacterium]|jgi:ribokinase|nr:MAG: ribokinase [Anaerolineaceae bacterium]